MELILKHNYNYQHVINDLQDIYRKDNKNYFFNKINMFIFDGFHINFVICNKCGNFINNKTVYILEKICCKCYGNQLENNYIYMHKIKMIDILDDIINLNKYEYLNQYEYYNEYYNEYIYEYLDNEYYNEYDNEHNNEYNNEHDNEYDNEYANNEYDNEYDNEYNIRQTQESFDENLRIEEEHMKKPSKEIINIIINGFIDKKEKCPIDMTDLTIENSCLTSCFHVFNKGLIENWMLKNKTCPVCRKKSVIWN